MEHFLFESDVTDTTSLSGKESISDVLFLLRGSGVPSVHRLGPGLLSFFFFSFYIHT